MDEAVTPGSYEDSSSEFTVVSSLAARMEPTFIDRPPAGVNRIAPTARVSELRAQGDAKGGLVAQSSSARAVPPACSSGDAWQGRASASAMEGLYSLLHHNLHEGLRGPINRLVSDIFSIDAIFLSEEESIFLDCLPENASTLITRLIYGVIRMVSNGFASEHRSSNQCS